MRNRLREITRNVGAFENVLYTSVVLSTRISFIQRKTLDDKFSSVEITYLKVTLTINYQKITFEINSREFYSQRNVLFTFNTWKIF